ncbi:MAG: hypothetical protein WCD37_17205 [Chloroflexia bacterium]
MAMAIQDVSEGSRDVTLFWLAESLRRASVPNPYNIYVCPAD